MSIENRRFILPGGQVVECRLIPSRAARKLRIRVKATGIEIVVPDGRTGEEAIDFLKANQTWATVQLERARKLAILRRPRRKVHGQVLFQGEPLPVHVIRSEDWRAPNRVILKDGSISIICALGSATSPDRSLENWLRKQARARIACHLATAIKHVRRSPKCVYVMDQRTKWGNCSAMGNLSFNWRLIMAPDHVLHYIVMHEVVHLAVPDHSPKFWLTVQSHCPAMERARQWLVANGPRLTTQLSETLGTPGGAVSLA